MESSTNTLWFDEVPLKTIYPSLSKDLKVDVVIIGGGLAGITTAYLLTNEGKKVAVLEKAQIGSGMSGFTTAFISANVDVNLQDLEKNFGRDKAALVWKSSQESIDLIEEIIKKEKIECEFIRCSAYEYTNFKKDVGFLKKEAQLAQDFGFTASFAKNQEVGFKNLACMEVKNQAKFHPRKYLTALAKAAANKGALIFEETEITEVTGKDPVEVRTEKQKIRADFAAILTHIPFNNPIDVQMKLVPYNTYVIEGFLNNLNLAEGIYWDTDEPYNYFRIDKRKGKTQFILGGKDHKTGQSQKREGSQYEDLEKYFRNLLPKTEIKTERRWSGQIIETSDGLPYIGKLPINDKQIIGTGFSGNGMTFATIAAMLTRSIVLDSENSWLQVYDPKRLGGVRSLVEEQISYIKNMVSGHFSDKKPKGFANIEKDSGQVVEINGRKVAVYKDETGKLIKLSPVCKHLGCIVDFNSAEKTWDCPCHGSRYTKEGAVINGPTQRPLTKLKIPEVK